MRKEVFLAISIGFILGLVITFGIWTANQSLKNLPQKAKDNSPTQTPSATNSDTSPTTPGPATTPQPNALQLNLTSPEDESLSEKNTIRLSGKTASHAAVVIMHETGEELLVADASGNFSLDLTLEGGYNLITVTATDSAGNSASDTRTVTYTTAKI